MNLFGKLGFDLMGQMESKTDRKPRPRRARLGSLVEQLETRAMLGQLSVGAPVVVSPPGENGPAVILMTQAPPIRGTATAADVAGALDNIESNGQIGVQLTDK
jgi:hypothetical protein